MAVGSHDNYIYIYAVAENGRKYSRVGKCSVSTCIYNPLLLCYFYIPAASSLYLVPLLILYIWTSTRYTLSSLCVDAEAVKT